MRVELDKKSLFALASDTRVDILRSLQPMRRTVSQLAEALGIDKAAVYRHLKKMEEGGLVKKYEDHGFVYYGLTWKARDLMSPNENTRIVILLSSTWILAAVAAMMLFLALAAQGLDRTDTVPNYAYDEGSDIRYKLAADQISGVLVIWVVAVGVFAVSALVLGRLTTKSLRKPKQRSPPPHPFSEADAAHLTGPLD